MQTITFYSYKGGVGRSLAMANVAKWLSEFQKRVCMIDFDLEAPGLHYKFQNELKSFDFKRGIVDYIHDFVVTKEVPSSIKDCVQTIQTSSKNPSINFIPAGNTSSPDYWKKLSGINWNDLFYKEDSEGVPFFLDLKEKIKSELNPEFLLIDSKTGISEISGITMSLYADKIVIVAANNDENLYGCREVIKSFSNAENIFFDKTPEIFFVLSRIPYPETSYEKARESIINQQAKRKLNFKENDNLIIIHSDRELELKESLKISFRQDKSVPIAEDYLNLFNKLTVNVLTEQEVNTFNNIKEAEILAQEAENKESNNDKIELLTKAIKLHSNNEDYYLKRGEAYTKKQEYDAALSDFREGIQLNENNIGLYHDRAWTYRILKKFDLAKKDLHKILEIKSDYKYAYLTLASIEVDENHLEAAINYLDKAIKIDPDYYEGYNDLAVIYRKKKDYYLAFENVYRSIYLEPTNGYPYSTLAEIYSDIGNIEEFYKNTELALIFKVKVENFINDDAYVSYLDEPRFKKLLEKYSVR